MSTTNLRHEQKNVTLNISKKKLCAGTKSDRNILTTLSPNQARPEKSGPTYNSAANGGRMIALLTVWLHFWD